MLTAYSRVTVVTAERTIDLALPSSLPLADVLPQVMRYAAPAAVDGSPTSWTLARLGGSPLSLSQTLGDAGVLDGDILELRGQSDDVRPAAVEDVRDTVEDSVDAAGGVWSTVTTRSYTVVVGAVALAATGLVSWLAARIDSGGGLEDFTAPGPAAFCTVVLLFATWWASRWARALDAQIAAMAAMLWAALLGSAIGHQVDLEGWETLVVAAAAVAIAAGVARALTTLATGHLATSVVLLVAGLLQAAAGWTDLSMAQVPRVVPVLVLLLVGSLPLVSLSVGGLASADYRVRHVGRLELAALRARYQASNAVLIGSLVGIALVIVWGGVTLDLAGSSWDRTLALSLAAAAILRSRLFSRTPHMLPLRTAGVVVVAFAMARFAVEEEWAAPWLAIVVAAILLAAIALSSLQMSDITRARAKRWLNVVEFLVVVDLLVVVVGAVGVYDEMGGLF